MLLLQWRKNLVYTCALIMTNEPVSFSRLVPMIRGYADHRLITSDLSLHANGVVVINNIPIPRTLSLPRDGLSRAIGSAATEHIGRALSRIELFLDH